MNIPGFTADASVYKTKGHYMSVVSNGASGVSGGVQLAQWDCGCGHLWGCAKNRCECGCPDADGYTGICHDPCCRECFRQ
jgi:hypothetical protein